MKCACKKEDCPNTVGFDALSKSMLVEGSGGRSILIYLDANSIIEMMAELRECLKAMTDGDV